MPKRESFLCPHNIETTNSKFVVTFEIVSQRKLLWPEFSWYADIICNMQGDAK